MKLLMLCEHYVPEEFNPHHHELTTGLLAKGHDVTMLTAFPHYGEGRVFKGYRGKVFQREVIDGVKVIRTWIYASARRSTFRRLMGTASYCISSLVFGLFVVGRKDVIHTTIPSLPLGYTGWLLAKTKRARLVISLQDVYPQAAVDLGVLTNRRMIRFFERMERQVYHIADHIFVISEGFRQNLIGKGVPPEKISIVSNWADPERIRIGPKENDFRKELNVGSRFCLVYSGGLTHNSNIEPVIHAAEILRDKPFSFVVLGEGVKKEKLQQLVAEKKLENVQFRRFVPEPQYPEVLRAADMNLVTLDKRATQVSVPSKIYKQMAAGRPVLAICSPENELARLVTEGQCGLLVLPDDLDKLVEVLQWAMSHPEELEQMGANARQYLVQYHSRARGVDRVENLFQQLCGAADPIEGSSIEYGDNT